MYLNGKMICEGHSISGRQLADALEIKTTRKEVDEAWLEEHGWSFPETWEEV